MLSPRFTATLGIPLSSRYSGIAVSVPSGIKPRTFKMTRFACAPFTPNNSGHCHLRTARLLAWFAVAPLAFIVHPPTGNGRHYIRPGSRTLTQPVIIRHCSIRLSSVRPLRLRGVWVMSQSQWAVHPQMAAVVAAGHCPSNPQANQTCKPLPPAAPKSLLSSLCHATEERIQYYFDRFQLLSPSRGQVLTRLLTRLPLESTTEASHLFSFDFIDWYYSLFDVLYNRTSHVGVHSVHCSVFKGHRVIASSRRLVYLTRRFPSCQHIFQKKLKIISIRLPIRVLVTKYP